MKLFLAVNADKAALSSTATLRAGRLSRRPEGDGFGCWGWPRSARGEAGPPGCRDVTKGTRYGGGRGGSSGCGWGPMGTPGAVAGREECAIETPRSG